MKWITRLEARFGRYAVPNLTLVIILGQLLAFVALQVRGPEVLSRLWLDREAVLGGEVWRLITFVFMPPATNPLFAFFAWCLFYLMGTALENYWGILRYNIYLFIGVSAAIVTGMLLPGGLLLGDAALSSTGYIVGSVFLAFAYLYPDFVINLFFVLPIRIKWLALITWVLLAIDLVLGTWSQKAIVVASVLNFFIFFGADILATLRNKRRRAAFESRVTSASRPGKPRHRCAVCGLTNLDDARMQFRYCSQCEGQLCYCMEHLQNHQHVSSEGEAAVAGGKAAD
jgi:hypothetical protein